MEIDRIYNIDVLEGLKMLPDNSIDLIITSPPYNKGYYTKNRRVDVYTVEKKVRKIDYGVFNDTMDPEDYEKWQRKILDECIRVLKPEGSIFYNHKEILSNLNAHNPTYVYDYPLLQTIVWEKPSTPQISDRYFYPVTEWIYWIKKTPDARPYFDRDSAIFNKAVWHFGAEKGNSHPAAFPIELPENCILACSKEGDIVLDPFMGSGTTALAAKKHGRHYIGFELNAEYIADANVKIDNIK